MKTKKLRKLSLNSIALFICALCMMPLVSYLTSNFKSMFIHWYDAPFFWFIVIMAFVISIFSIGSDMHWFKSDAKILEEMKKDREKAIERYTNELKDIDKNSFKFKIIFEAIDLLENTDIEVGNINAWVAKSKEALWYLK